MVSPDRATVCVSSQAGCAMGCTFCATGQAGFDRHLDVGEIVEQVAHAMHRSPRPVTNVVFMGMGEPMANFGPTWEAITRLHDDFGISARRITVSTVGVVPGMRRMAEESLPVTLAVSLHAPNDALRDTMVPINARVPAARGHRCGARGRAAPRPPRHVRVRVHRARERRARARRRARRAPRPARAARDAREPDPPEPDGRLRRAARHRPAPAGLRRTSRPPTGSPPRSGATAAPTSTRRAGSSGSGRTGTRRLPSTRMQR